MVGTNGLAREKGTETGHSIYPANHQSGDRSAAQISHQINYRSLLHSPSEAAAEYVQYAEAIRKHPGITWGVPSMDRQIIPMRPGDVVGIIARPGHGKSTLSAHVCRREGKRIAAAGMADKECAVYVSFEQSVEEIEALFQTGESYSVTDLAWGRADMEQVKAGAVERMRLPVWLMGESMNRRRKTPRMTVDTVYKTLMQMESEYHIKPTLVVFDYIQIVPVEGMSERTQQVSEAIVRSKELARYIGCPILMCVQASRAVDNRTDKIPTAADCQWASAIEQASDKLLGIWRPALTEPDARSIEVNGKDYQVSQRLFVAKLLKQRMAGAGYVFPMYFAPELVRLSDIESESVL